MRWQLIESERGSGFRRYVVAESEASLSWRDVLDRWAATGDFAEWFGAQLAAMPFEAFKWETPPLVRCRLDDTFEFVVTDAPWLAGAADVDTFAAHFDQHALVVRFANLGGGAELIAPCPHPEGPGYAHLAEFVRTAPAEQVRALWHEAATLVRERVGDSPLWLSTAGDGVAWLHVRLDDQPKYYTYTPYRTAPS